MLLPRLKLPLLLQTKLRHRLLLHNRLQNRLRLMPSLLPLLTWKLTRQK